MAEYIDLDTPLELYVDRGGFYSQKITTLRELLDTNKIPYTAADVRPVVYGKWIKYAPHNSDMMICSECEKYWILDGDQYDYHYCPNCGADMREES